MQYMWIYFIHMYWRNASTWKRRSRTILKIKIKLKIGNQHSQKVKLQTYHCAVDNTAETMATPQRENHINFSCFPTFPRGDIWSPGRTEIERLVHSGSCSSRALKRATERFFRTFRFKWLVHSDKDFIIIIIFQKNKVKNCDKTFVQHKNTIPHCIRQISHITQFQNLIKLRSSQRNLSKVSDVQSDWYDGQWAECSGAAVSVSLSPPHCCRIYSREQNGCRDWNNISRRR